MSSISKTFNPQAVNFIGTITARTRFLKVVSGGLVFLAGLMVAPTVGADTQALGRIPIQSGGRIKPFDTFARETLRLLYGKEIYNGKEAAEIVLTWHLIPQHWNDTRFLQINRSDLKAELRLETSRSHFSPDEVLKNGDRMSLLLTELGNRRRAQEKLNPYFQDIERLEGQISTYHAIVSGAGLKFVPPKEGTMWLGLDEMPETLKVEFAKLTTAFIDSLKEGGGQKALEPVVENFVSAARAENPTAYGSANAIQAEVHYNRFHPFRWAWIGYLLTALIWGVHLFSPRPVLAKLGWAMSFLTLAMHTYGFGLRVYLTGRPPVSNMYESVVWVSWGATLFGMFFERLFKRGFLIFSSSVVGILCLILADLAPNILDASIQPLQPVLRSTLWLTVHVLTITLGYAAFFVAFVLGDIALYFYIRGEEGRKSTLEALTLAIYRNTQVGVVLLAAGTILGGVWADYSWGRFWGWDPKETWALIALLGYVAVLHGRIGGWLKDFGFAAATVISFSLVIMAWYGVNYVLGAGLHSYGFGGGGVQYVALFVGLHLLYVIYAVLVRHFRKGRVELKGQT